MTITTLTSKNIAMCKEDKKELLSLAKIQSINLGIMATNNNDTILEIGGRYV